MKVSVYSACIPPRDTTLSRYIRWGKRKLNWSQARAPIITRIPREQATRHRDFPVTVNIVLGNACNLRCNFCPYHGITAPTYFTKPDEMSWETVSRIVEDLPSGTCAKFGAFEEPLLYYDKFSYLAEHLQSSGVGVHLTTNGTLAVPSRIPTLQSLRTIYISLDAATEETYRCIRGGDYDAVTRNTLAVADGFKGYAMGVSFIRQPKAVKEEEAFVNFWIDKVKWVILYALLVFDKDGYEIDQPFLHSPPRRVVCSSPWLETYVLPNGDVSLCCQTLVMTGRSKIPIMGNINDQSLSEIWNGEAYEQYREDLVNENWDRAWICEQCPLWAASYHKVEYADGVKVTRNPTTKLIERCLR